MQHSLLYPVVEGPLGFPMPDRTARHLDRLLRRLPALPEHCYRHLITTLGSDSIDIHERWDISWISTESVDRTGEVVLAAGMDDSQYRLNPLVTLGHDYRLPPVGMSRWRQRVSERGLTGIKARTDYPERPQDWPPDQPWLSDQVFSLVRAGLLRGKSIGFLPLSIHAPSEKERQAIGSDDVYLIIDEWLLLEYACVSLPANQDALVEAVAKGELLESARAALGLDKPNVVCFTALDEIEQGLARRLQAELPVFVNRVIVSSVERVRGRV